MLAVYIVLGIAAFLTLVLVLPISARVRFRDELSVCVRYAGVPVFRFPPRHPRPETDNDMAAHPSKKAKKTAKSNETREKLTELNKQLKEGGVSAALQYLRDMTALFAKAARRVLRAIVIDRMEAALVIATEDAAQTATEYGKACAVVYPVQALLESTFRVRRRRVEITPDFLAEQGRIFLDLRLHALPARLLWAGLRLLGGFLVHTIRNRPSA